MCRCSIPLLRRCRWNPDPSGRAHDGGIAVGYNVWQYYQVSGDVDYLVDYGDGVIDIECRGCVERLIPGHTVEFS